MRNYIRHSTAIPIEVIVGEHVAGSMKMQNLSAGGLSFVTHEQVKVGDILDVKISMIKPGYQGTGVVVWRRKQTPSEFEVGMRFTSDADYFRTRMVEQVCQIEDYRHTICANYGRAMSSEEAAHEWIAKFAKDFNSEEE